MSGLKVYVAVEATFTEYGEVIPRKLVWEDGKVYSIDRILDIRSAPALKAGGQGDRYTVRVLGKTSFLFFEHNPDPESKSPGRWFVERRAEG